MEVKVIRGYKLKLWKDRLKLAPEFIEMIDLHGMNLVHQEFDDQIILFTKIKNQTNPIPVRMVLTADELESISERVSIDAYSMENRTSRTSRARANA